ncbi:Proto oncogene serine:threonine protein kinase [Fasciolopsis buskii]|uniref:Proto oncogene serine:threonine protein kinase n=1 Tax=Fasciolopsis buskii TaxID=27845 RepID=A0A8E0VNL0_9TREM|nr:Proto oncogene serine:threonine protein kinase [Fasciolopsis buski]
MDSYTVIQQIGENTTTSVFRAIRNADGLPVVMKNFHLDAMEPEHLRPLTSPLSSTVKNVPSEHIMLEKVKDIPGCVQMIDYIDDSENGKWVIVLEDLCTLGYSNLAKDIGENESPMEDYVVSWIMRELTFLLDRLHSLGILHCDIKPDNMFVNYEDQKIKLIDFNLALDLTQSTSGVAPGCTPEYAPPEVLIQRKPWTTAGEVWSIGCTAFLLLCRRFPFENPFMSNCSSPAYPQCMPETTVRAQFGNYHGRVLFSGKLRTGTQGSLQPSSNGCLSPKAKDFLLLCLSRIPDQRPSLKALSQHPFLSLKLPSTCAVSSSMGLSRSRAVLVS